MTKPSDGRDFLAQSVVPLEPNPVFPCTPAQQRCWFLEQMQPGNSALNVAVRWEIRGKVDTSNIEQAFRAIIERHEIFRTRLIDHNGEPMQEVLPRVDFKLSVIDLTNLPEPERAGRAASIGEQEARRPFDLTTAPLLRVTAIRTAPDRLMLLVMIHQAAFDGWSIRVLGRELGQLLAAHECRGAPNLPELALQYGDYALWLDEYFTCAGFEAEKDYWTQQLAGAPYFEIGTDWPRGERRTSNGRMISAMLPKPAGETLEAAAKAAGISMFNLGCAVIAAILHRASGETDVVFGTQVAGRDDTDLENLIGVFINNLVLRFDASGDPSFRDFLTRAEETVRGALMHQKLPFHKLVELKNPPRDLARTPLIAINVILQRAFLEDARYETFELVGVPSPSPGAFYDLNFQMVGRPDGWRMALEYNSDLYAPETAEDMLAGWKAALEAVAANPDLRLSQLPSPKPRPTKPQAPLTAFGQLRQALISHASVADAAVVEMAAKDAKRAYGYVEPAADLRTPLEVLPDELMRHAGEQAPSQAAKLAGVSVLLKLPRLASGAVDEAALPPPPVVAPRVASPLVSSAASPSSRDLEHKVAAIWASALGVPEVSPNANFFDLGGHSLLAVKVLMRIEEAFGKRFDAALLFTAPVLRDFAAKLAEAGLATISDAQPAAAVAAEQDESWKVVTLQAEGDATPIIAINNLATLAALSRRIGPTRPAVCVRTFDPGHPQQFTPKPFEEIADDYIRLIRKARPQGPYVLFGLCMHGVLALAIAERLKEQGEDVPLVAVINCWEPAYAANVGGLAKWVLRFHDVGQNFKRLLRRKTTLLGFLGTYSIVHRSGVFKLAHRLGLIKAIPPRTGDPANDDFLLYIAGSRNDYRPKPYSGDMLLLRDNTTPRLPLFDETLGWGDVLTGHYEQVFVPPMNMANPNDEGVAVVVQHLQRALERAESRRRTL
jgi:acyl carrier protein